MATVNSTTSGNNAAADIFAGINGTTGKKAATTSTTADMANSFLTLLTTQLKNQDPLNPLDNAQVTSQLAQINTVSGIEKLNATLSKLLTAYDNAQAMQAAALIGKNVMVAGNMLQLADGQAIGGVKLDAAADNVTLTIKDAAGKVIQSEDLGKHDAGTLSFVWDGLDSAGNAVPPGAYRFSVEASAGGKPVAATALNVGTVSALTRGSNGFALDLGDGGSVTFDDVQQIL